MTRSAMITLTMILMTIAFGTASALAAQRTFVSAVNGNDTNPCTRPAPCRGFEAALAQTDPGGEVVVLDSGGYGPFTVSMAVSVIAPGGVHGAITSFVGPAVRITAQASDLVALRGLHLSGLGGSNGVYLDGGDAVVDRLVIRDFAGAAIQRAVPGDLTVLSSTLSRNQRGINDAADDPDNGIYVEDSVVEGNSSNGISFFDRSKAVIRHSLIIRNGGYGIFVRDDGLGASVVVENSLVSENLNVGVLVLSGTTAEIAVSGATIVFNAVGISGNVVSRGNNTVRHNSGSFASTFSPQ